MAGVGTATAVATAIATGTTPTAVAIATGACADPDTDICIGICCADPGAVWSDWMLRMYLPAVVRSGRGEMRAREEDAAPASRAHYQPAGPTTGPPLQRGPNAACRGLMAPARRASTVRGVHDVEADRGADDVRHPVDDTPQHLPRRGLIDPLLRAFGIFVLELAGTMDLEVPRPKGFAASSFAHEARDDHREQDDGEADNEDLEQFGVTLARADCKGKWRLSQVGVRRGSVDGWRGEGG